MRKLILHMMTTVDGFIADPEGRLGGGWTNWDEEMRQFYIQLFATSDTIMYGRGIFEEMVPGWAAIADGSSTPGTTVTDSDLAFANRLGEMTKIVVSTTLDHVDGNAILIRDNITEQITKLKEQPGTDILLYCGPRLVATLTQHGLIDEYMLYVNPTVLGQGTHLFRDVQEPLQLKLLKTKTFGSGVILTYYQPMPTA
jgi:dihydrofolate reductase